MPHRLAGLRPAIDHEPIAGLQSILTSKTIRKLHQATHQLRMRFGKIGHGGNMVGRDDEEVGWRLGVDVFEGQHPFTFCHDVRGKGALDDTAEEALRLAHRVW